MSIVLQIIFVLLLIPVALGVFVGFALLVELFSKCIGGTLEGEWHIKSLPCWLTGHHWIYHAGYRDNAEPWRCNKCSKTCGSMYGV